MPAMKEKIVIRGIDRSNDYRIICHKCKKDFGGTVGAIPGHKIQHITCEPCRWGSYENFLADWNARMEKRRHDSRPRKKTA